MFLRIVYSILFGAIQGLTEFLPISSSGHLLILHQIFNIQIDSLAFDVALHFGTLLALLLFFRKIIYQLFLNIFLKHDSKENQKRSFKLVVLIIIATIPAVAAGWFFEEALEVFLRNLLVVGWALIGGGFLLLVVDKYGAKQRDYHSLNYFESIFIGIAQALALIPGVSRSAITIIAGLTVKLQRKTAAEFSFLLAIPVIFGAVVKKFFDLNFSNLTAVDGWIFILGTLTAFAVGHLAIKYFIKFLEKQSLIWFGWYRIALGAIILLWLYL